MATKTNLKALIEESKDGEWGKDGPFDGSVEMTIIRGTDFDSVRLGEDKALPVRFIAKRIADRKVLQPNDIIFETAGGSKNRPTGRSVFLKPTLFQRSKLPITCASFARFIRIEPSKAHPEFIFWYLQYLYVSGHISQYHTQHTGVARFQYTDFAENFELILPPLETQRKIASILSAYDDLIENNTRRIKVLEEMAQAIYREWFVNFRFPGYEKVKMVDSSLGKIPEGWEVKMLGEVCSMIKRGISPKYDETSTSVIINQKCIRDFRLNLDLSRRNIKKVPKEKYVHVGDVLVNSTGVGTLGRVAQVLEPIEDCTVDSHVTIIRCGNSIEQHFFGLQLFELQDHFERLGQGATGQTELSRQAILETLCLFAPDKLQKKFSELIEQIRVLPIRIAEKNIVLGQSRDLLLPRLISGVVDVSKMGILGETVA